MNLSKKAKKRMLIIISIIAIIVIAVLTFCIRRVSGALPVASAKQR